MIKVYLDWNVIDEVLKLIHDSDNVAFFGTQFSHSVALHFQTDLLMLEKFTMAYMEQTSQLQCAKELDENSVAIILTVSGHIFNGSQKMISYIKKSNAKVVMITNDKSFDFGFEPNYIIEGKIDLVKGENGTVEIVDFKSEKKPIS